MFQEVIGTWRCYTTKQNIDSEDKYFKLDYITVPQDLREYINWCKTDDAANGIILSSGSVKREDHRPLGIEVDIGTFIHTVDKTVKHMKLSKHKQIKVNLKKLHEENYGEVLRDFNSKCMSVNQDPKFRTQSATEQMNTLNQLLNQALQDM